MGWPVCCCHSTTRGVLNARVDVETRSHLELRPLGRWYQRLAGRAGRPGARGGAALSALAVRLHWHAGQRDSPTGWLGRAAGHHRPDRGQACGRGAVLLHQGHTRGRPREDPPVPGGPLHDHFVEQGFVDLVRRRGQGPLFYAPERQKAGFRGRTPLTPAWGRAWPNGSAGSGSTIPRSRPTMAGGTGSR